MFRTKHFAVITTLAGIAVGLLCAYFLGAFVVKVPILDAAKPKVLEELAGNNSISTLDVSPNGIVSKCTINTPNEAAFCGFLIYTNGNKSHDLGIDVSNFDSFKIAIKARHNHKSPKVKITFKNFNANYSKLDDPISFKFNSVVLDISPEEEIYTIPFDFLQVESWWINQYNVSLEESQVDISNVTTIEFINQNNLENGQYDVEITQFELVGEKISLLQVVSIVLSIAVAIIFLLLDKQRYNERQASYIDPLTRLHNRRGQAEWLKKHRISPQNPKCLSLIYMDIDDFKHTNDTFGHHIGDLLLKGFTDIIKGVIEENGLTSLRVNFSRLSGDEFVVIGVDLSQESVESLAQMFLKKLVAPLVLEDNEIKVNISIGIALGTLTTNNLKTLFKHADSAMYFAKRQGKNQAKTYDEEVISQYYDNQETAEVIKQAIACQAFSVNFLPIFDIKTKRVANVEVLITTKFEGLTHLTPEDYLPIAEEYGLIHDIDTWMLETTLQALSENRELISKLSLTFMVGLSSIDVQDSHYTNTLTNLLEKYKVPPQWLALVIKETAFTVSTDSYTERLQNLRDIGVSLVLGDFGTGYTALNHLLYYPIQTLKIDKSFVSQVGDVNYDSGTIIQAILKIAHTYNMSVIAEGVENLEQFYFLEDQGCELIQGDLFSEALTLKELAKALRNQDA